MLTDHEKSALRRASAAARVALDTSVRASGLLSIALLDAIALYRANPTEETRTQYDLALSRLRQHNLLRARMSRLSGHLAAIFFIACVSWSAAAADIAGPARVIDGDTIVIAGTHIRLFGVDAPERKQTCQGHDGSTYECGRDATAVLVELTRSREVVCAERDHDRYDRVVAVCRTDAGELNAAMVRRGWAVEYRQYSHGRYRAEESAARSEGLGLWAGRFEMPAEWRHRHPH